MIPITKWAGLVTNASQYAIPPGATVEQVNLQCLVPGQLTVRPGMATVAFTNAVTTGGAVVRAFRYQHGSSEHIVFQDAIGNIYSSQIAAATPAVLGPPTPPSIASAVPGPNSIQVTAVAPAGTGGSPITGYTFQVSSDNQITWVAAGSSSSTLSTLRNLQAGVGYFVRAAATNVNGASAFSVPFGVVTPTADATVTIPAVPTNVTATAGRAMATVRWSAPATAGNSPVTLYTIQQSSDRGLAWTVAGTSALLSFDATGLLNETDYVFRVSASNAAGMSAYSTPSSSVTPTAGITVPSAPQSLSSTATSTSITLAWTAPSTNGGSSVTGYTVGYKLPADAAWTTASTSSTSYVITGLASSTNYNVRVAAVNANGTGAYATATATTSAAVSASVPGAPTALAVNVTKLSWTASWNPPSSDGGATITAYRLERASNPSGPWTVEQEGIGQYGNKQVAIAGGVTQYFRVSAKNIVGYGAYATANGTAVSEPSAPRNLSVSYPSVASGTVNATVNWALPSSDGGSALTTYSLLYESGGTRSIIRSSSAISIGSQSNSVYLPPGTAGSVIVSVCNAFGCTEASVSTTVPGVIPDPLIPTLSYSVASRTITLSYSANANEVPGNLAKLNTSELYWYGEYSPNNGVSWQPFSLGTGNVSPGSYVGRLDYPYQSGAIGWNPDVAYVRVAIGQYPSATGAIDNTKPRSPWAYVEVQMA